MGRASNLRLGKTGLAIGTRLNKSMQILPSYINSAMPQWLIYWLYDTGQASSSTEGTMIGNEECRQALCDHVSAYVEHHNSVGDFASLAVGLVQMG